MADARPYYGLPITMVEGNWGPDSCMTAAIAAYAPNAPWARIACPATINMNGAGTSASTPQIAAAVALWYEKYKQTLPHDWRRVEAVRRALFQTARNTDATHFGRGTLRALDALGVVPNLMLPKIPADSDSFAFLRVLTGLGIAEPTTRERMLNLELTQRYLMNPTLQAPIPDPEAQVSLDQLRVFAEAAIADKGASENLRRFLAGRYTATFGRSVPGAALESLEPSRAVYSTTMRISPPPYRRLRIYAVDPCFSLRLRTAEINEAIARVPWEDLSPGPIGDYIQVIDRDADGTEYRQVNLNDPNLLAQDGLPPSEGIPQFHQQMVYAVAMLTIGHFERALGRRLLWRPLPNPKDPFDDSHEVRRLTINPHALRETNAYYDGDQVRLQFGYFQASANDPGDHVPDSTVYTCLSHDIVAHETTHAILDGMHRRFSVPTNPDVLAFHEAFADIVGLMQHFTLTSLLENQIAQTRGNLEAESTLGTLAIQFGRATGGRGALRDAIGAVDAAGTWHRLIPDPSAYVKVVAPHQRGAILVAAMFDAFIAIYEARTADLLRIATSGTGLLPAGMIHPDLVRRLAAEASTSAAHVLGICIRAVDFVAPVDITFGEYLRGLITADFDAVAEDQFGYRVAFVEAFRRRGILPGDVPALSIETLRWDGVDLPRAAERYRPVVDILRTFADDCLYLSDRHDLFCRTRDARRTLHEAIRTAFASAPELAAPLGLDATLPFEVHELRRAERIAPDGQHHPQVVVGITQVRPLDVPGTVPGSYAFYGGTTLIIDLKGYRIAYAIRKRLDNKEREKRTTAFIQKSLSDPLTAMLVDPGVQNPFSRLHGLADLV
jgi:hypothetical protein